MSSGKGLISSRLLLNWRTLSYRRDKGRCRHRPPAVAIARGAALLAERIAVKSYSEIVRWLGDRDPTSCKLMQDILKSEEDHAEG